MTTSSFSTDVLQGTSYKFKVRAHNLHGWGAFSTSSIVLSTGVPDQPTAPTTVMRDIYVRVTWTTPGHNFEAIDKYQVKLMQSDGVTYTE